MENSKGNNKDEEICNKKNLKKECILHILILSILLIICIWDRIINVPKFPKNFLFLTQIDLYINIIYYSICVYYEIKMNKDIKEKYQLLFNLNFSISFVVFIMYWSMFVFQRETLYKKNTKIIVPPSLNILLHGGVFIFNLLILIFSERNKKKPKQKQSYIRIWFYFILTIAYIGILYSLKILFDIRVYPFIYGSILKFIFISISSFLVCLIGHYIYVLMTKTKKPKSKEKNFEQFEMN